MEECGTEESGTEECGKEESGINPSFQLCGNLIVLSLAIGYVLGIGDKESIFRLIRY